jgi:hypothetical protein
MSDVFIERSNKIHRLANLLPRFDYQFKKCQLPPNGVYLFFEEGESATMDGRSYCRIVRVGTHLVDGLFPTRIHNHYFSNCKGSVFGKHVRSALYGFDNRNSIDPPPLVIESKLLFKAFELRVSKVMAERFTFVCFPVETKAERLELESGLIALLAQYPVAKPSPDWLGHYASAETIRTSVLWNKNEVFAAPLNDEQMSRAERHMGVSLSSFHTTDVVSGDSSQA